MALGCAESSFRVAFPLALLLLLQATLQGQLATALELVNHDEDFKWWRTDGVATPVGIRRQLLGEEDAPKPPTKDFMGNASREEMESMSRKDPPDTITAYEDNEVFQPQTFKVTSIYRRKGRHGKKRGRKGMRNNRTRVRRGDVSQAATFRADIVVAKDGSGHFKKVQQAIDNASPGSRSKRTIIYVKKGVYKEHVVVGSNKKYITIVGDRGQTTIDDNKSAGDIGGSQGTALSSTFMVYGSDFTAVNIIFKNSFGFPNGRKGAQAVALMVWADRASFWSCTILGHQDSHLAWSGRQYYKACTIVGSVDFIFGDATAYFEDCTLKVLNDKDNRYAAIVAQYRQSMNYKSGFVFKGGKIVDGLKAPDSKAFLGRLWGPYCTIVYSQMYIDNVVQESGWDNMQQPKYEKTAKCFTFKNSGKGSNRKSWAYYAKELSAASVRQYNSINWVDGKTWIQQPTFWRE